MACPDTSCTESRCCIFAPASRNYSLFAASATFFAALEDEIRGCELRNGTVHFPLTKPVPVKLISRIAKLRAAGVAATAEKTALGPREKKTKGPEHLL
jgi:hypothetical protein